LLLIILLLPVSFLSKPIKKKKNISGPVHTMPEKFENGGLTLKTHISYILETMKGVQILKNASFEVAQNAKSSVLRAIGKYARNIKSCFKL